MCFVWISEQTAIIPPYNIGFYNQDGECLLRGTSQIPNYTPGQL